MLTEKDFLATPSIDELYPGEIYTQIQNPISGLQGWPGFRNRPGRLGLDPLDTDYELAHLQGVILRKMIDGVVFTRNPVVILAMFFYGLVCLFPLLISILETIQGRPGLLLNLPFLLSELLGILLIRNAVASVKGLLTQQEKS